MIIYRAAISVTCFIVMLCVLVIWPQPGIMISEASAEQAKLEHRIITDTLAAHKVNCLSRDGVIRTVLLDGTWIEVNEVELTNRTLILRTDLGSLSLIAVLNSP